MPIAKALVPYSGRSKPDSGTGTGSRILGLAIPRRSICYQRFEQLMRRLRDLGHSALESEFVRLGGSAEPAKLTHELK